MIVPRWPRSPHPAPSSTFSPSPVTRFFSYRSGEKQDNAVNRGVSRVRAQIVPTRRRKAVTHTNERTNERPNGRPNEHAGQRQTGRAQLPASKPASARAPGLDGVRALAVLAVLAFHEQFSAFPGGFLGVDIFFVLSGYLITD